MPPRVEQVRLGEVAAQGTRAIPGGTATAADFGAAAAAQYSEAGVKLERTAENLKALVVRTATENNEALAKQADTEFNTVIRNTLFDPEKGYFTLKGKAALDSYKPTEEQLRKLQAEAAAKITNTEARKMFGDVATRRLDAAFDSMAKHSAIERRQWMDSVSMARAMNAGDDAVAYAEDAAKREAALNIGRQEIISNAKDLGEDPEITNRKLREYDTKAYKGVVERMVVDDPMRAEKFYQDNKHRIDGQQQIGLERMLKEATGRRRAEDDANSVMARPGDVNAATLHSAIVTHESGGRQVDEKGKTLTSSKGALGAGQIMPDTFKRFAKPGERIDNKEDNLAVSKRMIDQYMRDYNGDWQRVAVAYFSGEGNVAPMASAKPYKVNSSDGHNTVEQYVANVGKNLGKTPGAAPEAKPAKTYSDPREAAREIEANFAAYAEKMKELYGDNPERLDKALTVLRQRKALAEEAYSAQLKVDTEKAWQIAITPDAAGLRPTSIDAIPPALWVKLTPQSQEALTRQFAHNLKGTQITTDQSVWYEVQRGLSSDDPNVRQQWAKKNLLEYRGSLSPQDFQELAKMQGAISKGDPDGHLTAVRSVNQLVDDTLRKLNIDPTPKESASPTSDAAKAAKFRRAVQDQLTALEVVQAKKATPEQTQQIIDAMTKEIVTGKGWLFDSKKRRFEVTIEDVPAEEKAKIIDALTRKHWPVTEASIIELFSRGNAKVTK